jgi:hypothetical protein
LSWGQALSPPSIFILSLIEKTGFSYENGHDSPWKTIVPDEKVIAFSI